MKIVGISIFLILTFGCSEKQTDPRIVKFEKILGDKQTKSVNLLVSDFEMNLDKLYPDLPTEKAYRQYLNEIISDTTRDWGKFKFQSKKTNVDFHQSGLYNEIYVEDSSNGLGVNVTGNYLKALYEVKNSDSLINKYWKVREFGGLLENELFVSGILSSNSDFNDYFHKRIVVLEFSF